LRKSNRHERLWIVSRLVAALLLAVLAGSPHALAAGFLVQEKSPRGLGSSFAGEGALAEDASTTYFNPAGLTLLDGTQLVAGAQFLAPNVQFTNDGSRMNPKIADGPLNGKNSNGGEFAFIPTTYLSQEVTPRLHVGIGVNAPFGLATEWDAGWYGRYHALKSSLRSIAIAPNVGFRVTDWLSVGAGMTALYAKATLTNALDMGGICVLHAPDIGLPSSVCPTLGLVPQKVDGSDRITGTDWGFGWNVGLLLTPTPQTRFGLTYRSTIDLDLTGDAKFTIPKVAQPLRTTGALVDTGAHAATTLPDIVSLSAFHQLTPAWAVFSDITWTHWDRFQDLTITFDNPKQPPVVTPEKWSNSFRFALGARWAFARDWLLRLGTAFDQSPITSDRFRTPRIPDSDRVWASFGLGYQLTQGIRLDFSYAHIFGLGASTDNRDPVTGHILRGSFSSRGEIVGAQASVHLW
jgi:long-chain fatty acid transport protein